MCELNMSGRHEMYRVTHSAHTERLQSVKCGAHKLDHVFHRKTFSFRFCALYLLRNITFKSPVFRAFTLYCSVWLKHKMQQRAENTAWHRSVQNLYEISI